MKFDPFSPVSGTYGAPMGRLSCPSSDFVDVPVSCLRAIHEHEGAPVGSIDEGYDKGGAYWGLPDNVWAVVEVAPNGVELEQDPPVTYVRAPTAVVAILRARGEELPVNVATLSDFTRAYIEAIYFTNGQGTDDDEFGPDDELAEEAVDFIKRDCETFQRVTADLLEEGRTQNGYDRSQAGHDFWLTRNRHGTGFWDRGLPDAIGQALTKVAQKFGGVIPYKGGDGLVYLGNC